MGNDSTERSAIGDLVHKVRDVSQEKSNEILQSSLKGLKTTPYYLWTGMKYAFTHGYIWKSLVIPFIGFAIASIVIFIILLLFLYKPQEKIIDNVVENDDLSEFYSYYLLLQETKFLVNIFFMVFLDVVRRSIYDQIFEREGKDIKSYHKLSEVGKKERLIIVMYSVATTFALELITAPLLSIPVGGKILISLVKGWALAWSKF